MPHTAYIDVARFKLLSVIPNDYVDEAEAQSPGFTLTQLQYWSAWIDSRLGKRYRVPFVGAIPIQIEGWLARIVTPRVWEKRGVNATDEQWGAIMKDEADARAEVEGAANGEVGLYDLPSYAGSPASGIARGFPLSYSESSPYVWYSEQGRRATSEDSGGGGTGTGGAL